MRGPGAHCFCGFTTFPLESPSCFLCQAEYSVSSAMFNHPHIPMMGDANDPPILQARK